MAGAPLGNKNNEIWTKDVGQKFVNNVYDYVKARHDCTSLEKACCEFGEYEALISYLKSKKIGIDFEPIKKAKALIKNRLIEKGLKNEYNPTMVIFILKNNHDMKDKSNVKHAGKVKQDTTIIVESVELKDGIDKELSRLKK